MRLDGRFRDAELIGDLLVEQAFRQHHQHPHLLRGQRHQPVAQARHVRIGGGCEIGVRRHPDVAIHHLHDRVAQRLDPEPLGNEPGGAEIQRPADGAAIVAGGHDHHRDRRILRAQVNQAGEAGDPRHRQIEQDQIDIGILLQQRGQFLERSGFVDLRRGHDACNRLPQRIAKQRMVIGNDEVGAGSGSHLFLARGLRQTRDRFMGLPGEFSAAIVLCRAVACKRTISPCDKAVNPVGLCAAIGRHVEQRSCADSSASEQCRGPKVLLGEVSRRCYREAKPMAQSGQVRRMGASFASTNSGSEPMTMAATAGRDVAHRRNDG